MMKSIFILLGLVDNTLALQFSAAKPGGLLAPVTKANLWDVVKTTDAATSYIDWKELDKKYQTMLASRGGAKPSPKVFDEAAKDAWVPFLTYKETKYDPTFDRIKNFRDKANTAGPEAFCSLTEPTGKDNRYRGKDVGQTYLEVIPTRHLLNLPLNDCEKGSDCGMKDTHTINGVQVRRGDAGKSAQPWNYFGEFKIEYARHLQDMVFRSLQHVQGLLDAKCKKDPECAKLPEKLRPKARVADTDPNNRTSYDRKYLQRSQLQPGLIFPTFHHTHVSRSLTHMHVYVVLDPEDPKFFGTADKSQVGWDDWVKDDIFYGNGMSVEQMFRNIIDGENGTKTDPKSFNMNRTKRLVVASL